MITIPSLRKMYLRLFQLETGVFAVEDPGEGPGRYGHPLFFDQNEARRAETQFFGDRPRPLSQGLKQISFSSNQHVSYRIHLSSF